MLKKRGLLDNTSIHLAVIILLAILAYSNTFGVPFQWDEQRFIEGNPIVRDLNYFLEPSKAEGLELYDTLKGRYVGYLTFALNYEMHGLDVTGYHIVNLIIHVLNALLVYFLVVLTFRTPFLEQSSLKERSKYIALFSALLFVSHPVQTEAVTYIFQRLASLAAFFYMLSLAAYIKSRLSKETGRQYSLYALSFIAAVLAMKTKENAFTLPVVIALYEFFFFTGPGGRGILRFFTGSGGRRILRLVPLLATLFIIPLTLTGIDKPVGAMISSVASAPRGFIGFSQTEYLFTSSRVVVTYIRLLFLPVGQVIDYDYPIYGSFMIPQVFLSFLFLFSILCLGVFLLFRSRAGEPALRLIAFGIFWFFITLSVESSIIPIPMIIAEYRVYLPSVGAVFSMVAGAFLLLERVGGKKIRTAGLSFLILLPVALSTATYMRNTVWQSKISLWEDVVRKSPGIARAHDNLAVAYANNRQYGKALEIYEKMREKRFITKRLFTNIGSIHLKTGQYDEAIDYFRKAASIDANEPLAYLGLGLAYLKKAMFGKAVEQFDRAIVLSPHESEAYLQRGTAYREMGDIGMAVSDFTRACKMGNSRGCEALRAASGKKRNMGR